MKPSPSIIDHGKELVGSAVQIFRDKVGAWYQDYLRVVNDKRQLPPELEEKRRWLISYGDKIKKLVESMGVDLSPYAGTINQNLGALAVPIIAAGAATAISGMIAYWHYDYKKFTEKTRVFDNAIKAGASPIEASRAIANLEPISFKKIIMVGAVLGGLYWYYRYSKKG